MTGRHRECGELFAALSQYLDAELPPGDCAEIEAHIAGCAPCVEFVNSLRKSIALTRAEGNTPEAPPLPPDVREQLLAAYRKGRTRAAGA